MAPRFLDRRVNAPGADCVGEVQYIHIHGNVSPLIKLQVHPYCTRTARSPIAFGVMTFFFSYYFMRLHVTRRLFNLGTRKILSDDVSQRINIINYRDTSYINESFSSKDFSSVILRILLNQTTSN